MYEFPDGGNVPVRSQGSRWITHRRKALQRILDRYGVYINHLLTLIEDRTIKSETRAQLKGFLLKWRHSNLLIGVAMYVEVLKAPSILSQSLQDQSLDVVSGIKAILKASKSLNSLSEINPKEWPTTKVVQSRISKEDGEHLYQGASLYNFNDSVLQQCGKEAMEDLKKLDNQMRARLQWSDVALLRAILAFLDTRGWTCRIDDRRSEVDDDCDDPTLSEVKTAVEYIISHFREPLQASGIDLTDIQDEVEEIVEYARQYLSIEAECYNKVWYKLYISPDSQKWKQVLALCELLFSLPFSNGHVERIFSTLKIIKTDRRTNLLTSTLCDLLEVTVEGPPLTDFNAKAAVELWWKDCQTTRRVNQVPRKEYRPRQVTGSSSSPEEPSTSSSSTDTDTDTLNDWDDWFHNY